MMYRSLHQLSVGKLANDQVTALVVIKSSFEYPTGPVRRAEANIASSLFAEPLVMLTRWPEGIGKQILRACSSLMRELPIDIVVPTDSIRCLRCQDIVAQLQ